MNSLGTCYIDFEKFPQNLPDSELPTRRQKAYTYQLDQHSNRLFCDDVRLCFWDLNRDATTFELYTAKSLEDVRRLCLLGSSQEFQDDFHILDCRFIFLYSFDSRSPLYTRRAMLMLALSYHTVDAWFLDFLFPFGEQEDPIDPRFSSFRQRIFSPTSPNLALPRLDRSGHEYHLCYNLRAVETTRSSQVPWSVRQTVMYHSFDVGTGQALFVVLKGNDLMKKELREETAKYKWTATDRENKISKAFHSSLKSQLVLCWWSCDGWRGYINHLESMMKDLTDRAVFVKAQKRPAPMRKAKPELPEDTGKFNILRRLTAQRGTNTSLDDEHPPKYSWKEKFQNSRPETKASQAKTTIIEERNTTSDPSYTEMEFPDLQRAQLVEEKANEAIYALKTNVKIIKALRDFYSNLPDISASMQQDAAWFVSQLEPILCDLETYHTALEALGDLFSERKQLLLGILDFQNTQAGKYFAEKAQISADTMEKMTDEMRELTRKTKEETVSMTAVAVVTMFFLPGTFVSALMSTDIVKWSKTDDGIYDLAAAPGARNLFLSLTLPLMFITFVVWILWRRYNREENDYKKHLNTQSSNG